MTMAAHAAGMLRTNTRGGFTPIWSTYRRCPSSTDRAACNAHAMSGFGGWRTAAAAAHANRIPISSRNSFGANSVAASDAVRPGEACFRPSASSSFRSSFVAVIRILDSIHGQRSRAPWALRSGARDERAETLHVRMDAVDSGGADGRRQAAEHARAALDDRGRVLGAPEVRAADHHDGRVPGQDLLRQVATRRQADALPGVGRHGDTAGVELDRRRPVHEDPVSR